MTTTLTDCQIAEAALKAAFPIQPGMLGRVQSRGVAFSVCLP